MLLSRDTVETFVGTLALPQQQKFALGRLRGHFCKSQEIARIYQLSTLVSGTLRADTEEILGPIYQSALQSKIRNLMY